MSLIYIWIAQNIFLVVSSIWRTHLYIQEYSLTMLRLSAMVWMALVAMGLVLIIVRIVCRNSNTWLVNANALCLVYMLFVCSAVNIPGMIAHYNVRHNAQISGEGQPIDLPYLTSLGSAALSAIDWLVHNNDNRINDVLLDRVRFHAVQKLNYGLADWRSWSFRSYSIARQRGVEQAPTATY